MNYPRFLAMIATSTVVMFGLMYLNTYLVSHVFWSETRAYMAVLMGATMAIVMLAFMFSMYPSRKVNAAILAGAAVIFGGALWLVRSQVTVEDTSYMRAMIPHHSIAIMTSSRADISDPRARKLADEIIFAQDKEIAEMRYLINDIEVSGDAPDIPELTPAAIVSLEQALATAEIPILDPEFMTDAEIAQLFPEGPICRFSYTPDSKPVLVAGEASGEEAGLFKISGDLVRLSTAGDALFNADGVRIGVTSPEGGSINPQVGTVDAILGMELDGGLTAGYRGYFQCSA